MHTWILYSNGEREPVPIIADTAWSALLNYLKTESRRGQGAYAVRATAAYDELRSMQFRRDIRCKDRACTHAIIQAPGGYSWRAERSDMIRRGARAGWEVSA